MKPFPLFTLARKAPVLLLVVVFLFDLQNMARLSGKPFEEVVRDELARIAGVVGDLCERSELVEEPVK